METGRRSREQKKKKQLTTSPESRRKKNLGGEADEEKKSREQRFLGSNSVNDRTKSGSNAVKESRKSEHKKSPQSLGGNSVKEKIKSEKKKSPQSLGGHSVASMRRRRERGGCPARGEGLFPDITTGCQVNFLHLRDNFPNYPDHQEFYMCHHGHRMGQFSCPGGTLFSSQHETCDWKGKVMMMICSDDTDGNEDGKGGNGGN